MNEEFYRYEQRFNSAAANLPYRKPWQDKERIEIAEIAKKSLGIKDEYLPHINVSCIKTLIRENFIIECLEFVSWQNVIGAAHLYLPKNLNKKNPFVLLCHGHGEGGKTCNGYQIMAQALVHQGIIVLVPDVLGAGERTPMGHSDCVIPFACGLSVQGLIIMEALAWLEWAKNDTRIDAQKMAAIGNSGGGTATMFLGALCPYLAALSSSGYPSSFDFIARKEKKHCHCNIIPGVIGKIEMWELYSLFAPKPLLIFQGGNDCLIPQDYFYSLSRKIQYVYRQINAEKQFFFRVTDGEHAWDLTRTIMMVDYLTSIFSLNKAAFYNTSYKPLPKEDLLCIKNWPKHALTTDELACTISGLHISSQMNLWDVYKPRIGSSVEEVCARGNMMQIFAQYEAFLETKKIFNT